MSYIVNDCEAKVFITSRYKADQAQEIVADTPGVDVRLMLDGTIDGYESYELALAAQSPAARRGPDRRDRHAVLVGHPVGRRCHEPFEPVRDDDAGWRCALLQIMFGDQRQRLPLAGAVLPCGSAAFGMGIKRSAQRGAMEHFDASGTCS